MKTSKDPRHLERVKVVQEIYAWEFSSENEVLTESGKQILENLKQIDEYIHASAPKWDVAQINRLDLAVLRLAVYELLIKKEAPPKVAIDEAVEIAKEYGSDASPSFINGALGKVVSINNITT